MDLGEGQEAESFGSDRRQKRLSTSSWSQSSEAHSETALSTELELVRAKWLARNWPGCPANP